MLRFALIKRIALCIGLTTALGVVLADTGADDGATSVSPELEKYRKRTDHFRHAIGYPPTSKRWERGKDASHAQAWAETDRAWSVMLYRQGIIDHETAAKLLSGIRNMKNGGEAQVLKAVGGDSDVASASIIGRTRQEPMCRMVVRDKQLDVMGRMLKTMDACLVVGDKHAETVMNGQTHMADAQPTTYGAYQVAVFDGLQRGFEQMELAYSHTNKSSVGCGALSGSGWPIDRMKVADLLGFDGIVEPSYDCEAGQDHALTTLFALTNITNLMSRTAMDHYIWMMDGNMWFVLPGGYQQPSSMMPQKESVGCVWEHMQIKAAEVGGLATRGMLACHNQPFQDQLPIYVAWKSVNSAAKSTEHSLSIYGNAIQDIQPQEELLLKLASESYSCAADVKVVLTRDYGYGLRHAHRVVATFFRLAKERGIPANRATGALLDEAAEFLGEEGPHMPDQELRDLLDPVKFLERHTNPGDPNPDETRRMVQVRRERLAEMQARHDERQEKIKDAHQRLLAEIDEITGN
ncbi:lyase family protein [Aeoliella sp.]|uniref:lyase family protein n=1 Tax=Aeoliella sp. TaxID=2795800 RepID=UPI003CCBEB99